MRHPLLRSARARELKWPGGVVPLQCAVTLVSLSNAPTAIAAAANCYCQMLVSQSDNNVKLIVLDRLQVGLRAIACACMRQHGAALHAAGRARKSAASPQSMLACSVAERGHMRARLIRTSRSGIGR